MRSKLLGTLIGACVGIFLFSGVCVAHDWTAGRQARQLRRTHQGTRSAQLTGVEKQRLLNEQRRIRHERMLAWRDGELEPWEARCLDRMLDRASDDIYWAKHNCLRRHPLRAVCRAPRRWAPRRACVAHVWPDETHFFFRGFFSDPSWGFGWFISDP